MRGRGRKRENKMPFDFMLQDICGWWISDSGSPTLHIFYDGKCFRITYAYNELDAFTLPIQRTWGITFFYLFGFFKIDYDPEKDELELTLEGKYRRLESHLYV